MKGVSKTYAKKGLIFVNINKIETTRHYNKKKVANRPQTIEHAHVKEKPDVEGKYVLCFDQSRTYWGTFVER